MTKKNRTDKEKKEEEILQHILQEEFTIKKYPAFAEEAKSSLEHYRNEYNELMGFYPGELLGSYPD